MLRAGQTDQAMQKVDAVLAQKPRDAQMRFFKGLILTEQGKSNDAIQVFLHLTEDYPELPEPYNNLAVLYASQGEYEKARASLEMAIRTHPSYATAHENLGDVYAKLASQAYDKALQLDSNNTAAQSKLALIRELISVNSNGGKQKPWCSKPAGHGERHRYPEEPDADRDEQHAAPAARPRRRRRFRPRCCRRRRRPSGCSNASGTATGIAGRTATG